MKSISKTYKEIVSDKETFKKWNYLIKNFWLSTKGQVKNMIKSSNDWKEIETYITLCPFYDKENWWIRWDYESFSDIWPRYKSKLQASLDVLEFLKTRFNLKVNFLLADRWVLISENYDTDNFDNDIKWIIKLYSDKISETIDDFEIKTFTDIWIEIDQISNLSEDKDIKDIEKILKNFEIDYDKFKFSLDIIIKSFWITWAYYLILNYLKENKQLLDLFQNSIFVNTEATSPLNSLYTAWKYKLDSQNLFARVDINS